MHPVAWGEYWCRIKEVKTGDGWVYELHSLKKRFKDNCEDFEESEELKMSKKYKKLDCIIEEALLADEGLIIIGSPNDEDENHNCDRAGCSSVSHVVYRFGEPQCSVIDVE